MKRTASALTLISVLLLLIGTQFADLTSAQSFEVITINTDGSIDSSSAPIQRNGNVYSFTGDINGSLVIKGDNLIVDGADHKLEGYGKQQKETLYGIIIEGNNVTVKNTEITGFFSQGVQLAGSNNTLIFNKITKTAGVWCSALYVSGSGNNISSNELTGNNGMGMYLAAGTGNVISNNYIADNEVYGIQFMGSTATLRNDTLQNNKLGAFNFMESTYTSPVQDIDASNIVDGMPVCYWVNQHYKTVPLGSGYVLLINCTNILVKGLSIANSLTNVLYNSNGIYLVDTVDSTIRDNTLQTGSGIRVVSSRGYSQNITITDNNIEASVLVRGSRISIIGNSFKTKGIDVGSDTLVTENNLTSIGTGITVSGSGNKIFQNNIMNCDLGVQIIEANNNVFYNNNFINNKQHVSEVHYTLEWPPDLYRYSVNNTWDGGYAIGGNYWSDYTGQDLNKDGIGDTPYIVFENMTDNYPLMGQFEPNNKLAIDLYAPIIAVLSPENKTYNTADVNLNFTVNELFSWIGYSIDAEDNVTISGNTTLTALSEGSHSLVVYANDTVGNVGTSEVTYFDIEQKTEIEQFPTIPVVIASGVSLAAIGVGLLVYYRKRKEGPTEAASRHHE